jgi:hypothetical protein
MPFYYNNKYFCYEDRISASRYNKTVLHQLTLASDIVSICATCWRTKIYNFRRNGFLQIKMHLAKLQTNGNGNEIGHLNYHFFPRSSSVCTLAMLLILCLLFVPSNDLLPTLASNSGPGLWVGHPQNLRGKHANIPFSVVCTYYMSYKISDKIKNPEVRFNSISSVVSYLQEDSQKTGKVTSAGMYFLHFQVYRMDSTVNAVCMFCFVALVLMPLGTKESCCVLQLAMAKDPEAAFFKRLEGLQPCEVSTLKPGTHIFAVYGMRSCFFCSYPWHSSALSYPNWYV